MQYMSQELLSSQTPIQHAVACSKLHVQTVREQAQFCIIIGIDRRSDEARAPG